jgi:hypothetical protein
VSKRFFVVYEAPADLATATELADRVLTAEIDWLDETLLNSQRRWIGEDRPGEPLTWTSIPTRAQAMGIKVHGHFNGEPGLADARAARRALAYVLRRHEGEAVDAILLIRDRDDQPERRQGLEQGRASYSPLTTIVVGLAVPERECWVLSGFEPKDDGEREKLEEEIRHLGFHPCRESHQLTACKDDQAKRSPKRVHAKLIGRDRDRERECWQVTPLSVLLERGADNGLRDFLEEVKDFLVPLITGYEGEPGKS